MNWRTVENKKHEENKGYNPNAINEYIDWYENDKHKKKIFLTCEGGRFIYGLLGGVKNSRYKTIYKLFGRKWRDKR